MQTAVHPVVLRHSLTWLPALYCSDQLTDRFEGWTLEESKPILDYLHAQATQPAYTIRHAWKPGDLVFWDNRCINHYAPLDYDTTNMEAPENHRLMYRTTLAGDPIVDAADRNSELRIASRRPCLRVLRA
jgi:taurine dioxygenase